MQKLLVLLLALSIYPLMGMNHESGTALNHACGTQKSLFKRIAGNCYKIPFEWFEHTNASCICCGEKLNEGDVIKTFTKCTALHLFHDQCSRSVDTNKFDCLYCNEKSKASENYTFSMKIVSEKKFQKSIASQALRQDVVNWDKLSSETKIMGPLVCCMLFFPHIWYSYASMSVGLLAGIAFCHDNAINKELLFTKMYHCCCQLVSGAREIRTWNVRTWWHEKIQLLHALGNLAY